jgi:hypothetical protein
MDRKCVNAEDGNQHEYYRDIHPTWQLRSVLMRHDESDGRNGDDDWNQISRSVHAGEEGNRARLFHAGEQNPQSPTVNRLPFIPIHNFLEDRPPSSARG